MIGYNSSAMLRFIPGQRCERLHHCIRLVVTIVLTVTLFMISGCTNTRETNLKWGPSQVVAPYPGTRERSEAVDEFIGLSEEAARQLAARQNRPFRVRGFVSTAEHCFNRITVKVEDGIVIDAEIEE